MLNKDEITILRSIKLVPFLILLPSLIVITVIFQNNNQVYSNNIDQLIASAINKQPAFIQHELLTKKRSLDQENRQQLIKTMAIGGSTCLIIFLISLAFAHKIKRHFIHYNLSVKDKTNQLNELNLHLESKVKKRTKALVASNKELEQALNNLQQTQSKLITSEKMASMVGLVTGVAHELNTPMGIMMTALSQIENEIEKIYEKIKAKKISKNELVRSELACQTSVALLQNNLDKSIKLVQNFKSLSIAGKQEQQQEFSINELINTLNDSYQSLLNEQNITLNVFGADDVIILSYQDVVIDVLSQLIDNSITHAFNHGDDAQITLMLSTTNEQLLIDYVDNGKGLCEEAKARIFDLFYTTKRNSHCTGLGMPIVYNQVTQQLQGTIEYKAPPHQGVGFTITLPMLYQKTAYQLI